LIKELTRVLKPGGPLVSVDGSTSWPVFDNPNEINTPLSHDEAIKRAPEYCLFTEHIFK
jgi:ubiquinone/menaquinone biosynthesis C-methylase UbiE